MSELVHKMLSGLKGKEIESISASSAEGTKNTSTDAIQLIIKFTDGTFAAVGIGSFQSGNLNIEFYEGKTNDMMASVYYYLHEDGAELDQLPTVTLEEWETEHTKSACASGEEVMSSTEADVYLHHCDRAKAKGRYVERVGDCWNAEEGTPYIQDGDIHSCGESWADISHCPDCGKKLGG